MTDKEHGKWMCDSPKCNLGYKIALEKIERLTQRIAELEKEVEVARREGFEAGAHWCSNAGTHGKIPGVICISERTIEDGWQKYLKQKSLKG